MSKKIIPFIVAFVLICLVMGVSGVFAFSGLAAAEKFGSATAWSQPYNTAESMKVLDLNGDGQDELFIQNASDVSVYDGSGAVLWNFPYAASKTTLGDFNGDNIEDILVFHPGTGMSVDAIIKGEQTRVANSLEIGTAARIILLRYAAGPQVVLGDSTGNLLSIGLDGKPLWKSE